MEQSPNTFKWKKRITTFLSIIGLLSLILVGCGYISLRADYARVCAAYETGDASVVSQNETFAPQEGSAAVEMETISTEVTDAAEDSSELENSGEVSDESGSPKLIIPFHVNLKAWNYTLVNSSHEVSEDYSVNLTDTRNGKQVDRRIRVSLESMLDDAAAEGHQLMICSAYRDYAKQAELLNAEIRKGERQGLGSWEAYFEAGRQLETPGFSEHHTGLAVDIVGVRYQSLDEGQGRTKEARWLAEHCAEYGFILRYPADKEEITGIEYESWHFRYVGKQAAAFMKEKNLCLEEFLLLAEEAAG